MTIGKVNLEKHAKKITYGYIIALFAVSMLPINGKDSVINNTYVLSEIRLDYFMHSILLLPWMLLRLFYAKTSLKEAIQWFFMGILLAILAEGVQYFLPYRTYNVIDLVANLLGVFLGAMLWRLAIAILGNFTLYNK